MGRKLKEGWWENTIEPAIREIESGVSPDELWKYLQGKNAKITDFRHLIIRLSHGEGDEHKKDEDKKKEEEHHEDEDKKKEEEHHEDEEKHEDEEHHEDEQ